MTTRTKPGDGPHPRSSTGLRAFVGTLLLSSCVTTYDDEDPVANAVPMVVATTVAPDGADPALAEFYGSVMAQLQEAHQGRDFARMRLLVDTYLVDYAPEWAVPRLVGFRDLSYGLQFESHAASNATLVQAASSAPEATESAPTDTPLAADSIGAPLEFELRIASPPDGPWRLGGEAEADPIAFRVTLVIQERFLDGSTRRIEDAEVVRLGATVELGTEPLVLPVRIDLGPSLCARRDVDITAELMPGYVQNGDARAPVRFTRLCQSKATQWPKGHESVRKAPLAALRKAMEPGERDRFLQARLAAEFAPPADRPAVADLLMQWVRLGTPQQALVAMATLASIDPSAKAPLGDRDAWLLWWESRR